MGDKNYDHVVLSTLDPIKSENRLLQVRELMCFNCGQVEPVVFPTSLLFAGMVQEGFLKMHKRCEKRARGDELREEHRAAGKIFEEEEARKKSGNTEEG